LENDRFTRACRLKRTDSTPIWFMRQAGRYLPEYRKLREKYGILELFKDPHMSSELTLLPVKRLGVDAAIVFADIMTPLEGMGILFKMKDNIGPVVSNPVRNIEDVDRLKTIDPHVDTAYVMESIRLSNKALKGRVPVIGFAGAPFTLASYIVDGIRSDHVSSVKRFMYEQTDAWHKLMYLLAKVSVDYTRAQVKSGAGAVQIFDSWAGDLSPQDYKEHVFPYVKYLFDGLSDTGVPTIYFSTGTSGMLDEVRKAGADVISVDWRVDIGKAWSHIGKKAIQGNLDPAIMLSNQKTIEKYAKKILDSVGTRNGHIFNLGHGVLPDTPPENAAKLVKLVHELTAR
jgi:uroporphyrinogen decarboxylase